MAGKPIRMSQVKQILRMHLQCKGKKTIARALSISKNTVKEYLAKATGNPMAIADLLELEDPVLETEPIISGTLLIKMSATNTSRNILTTIVRNLIR